MILRVNKLSLSCHFRVTLCHFSVTFMSLICKGVWISRARCIAVYIGFFPRLHRLFFSSTPSFFSSSLRFSCKLAFSHRIGTMFSYANLVYYCRFIAKKLANDGLALCNLKLRYICGVMEVKQSWEVQVPHSLRQRCFGVNVWHLSRHPISLVAYGR